MHNGYAAHYLLDKNDGISTRGGSAIGNFKCPMCQTVLSEEVVQKIEDQAKAIEARERNDLIQRQMRDNDGWVVG